VPFKPNTYPTPTSALSEEQADPASFQSFNIHAGLKESLGERFGAAGQTTYIQSLSMHHLCSEDTVVTGTRTILGAETGSGKTFAYLLPVMHNLKASESAEERASIHPKERRMLPRAIVLQPTHELTRQSTAMAKSLVHKIKLSVMGMSNNADGGVRGRKGHMDILFGTGAMTRRMMGIRKPGLELEENFQSSEWVGIDRLDWLVIDEADVMLSEHPCIWALHCQADNQVPTSDKRRCFSSKRSPRLGRTST
jgi:ATP-dependent RNA helicase MRH4